MYSNRLHLLARVFCVLVDRGCARNLPTPEQAYIITNYLRANGCDQAADAAAPFPQRFTPSLPPNSQN
jgi:hypothetical protein